MINLSLIKIYSGIVLILIGLLGGCLAFLFTLGIEFSNSFEAFGMHQGSSSNTPFLFGMLAIAGAWLLGSIKGE